MTLNEQKYGDLASNYYQTYALANRQVDKLQSDRLGGRGVIPLIQKTSGYSDTHSQHLENAYQNFIDLFQLYQRARFTKDILDFNFNLQNELLKSQNLRN